jgi:hypothetical protein
MAARQAPEAHPEVRRACAKHQRRHGRRCRATLIDPLGGQLRLVARCVLAHLGPCVEIGPRQSAAILDGDAYRQRLPGAGRLDGRGWR